MLTWLCSTNCSDWLNVYHGTIAYNVAVVFMRLGLPAKSTFWFFYKANVTITDGICAAVHCHKLPITASRRKTAFQTCSMIFAIYWRAPSKIKTFTLTIWALTMKEDLYQAKVLSKWAAMRWQRIVERLQTRRLTEQRAGSWWNVEVSSENPRQF